MDRLKKFMLCAIPATMAIGTTICAQNGSIVGTTLFGIIMIFTTMFSTDALYYDIMINYVRGY